MIKILMIILALICGLLLSHTEVQVTRDGKVNEKESRYATNASIVVGLVIVLLGLVSIFK